MKKKEQKLADKMIKIMQEAELTLDQMLDVIKLAQEKMKKQKLYCDTCSSIRGKHCNHCLGVDK